MSVNQFAVNPLVQDIVRLALAEDIGTGDVTTGLVVKPGTQATGRLVARQSGIVAGLPVVEAVFQQADQRIIFEPLVADGQVVEPDQVLANLAGPAASLLQCERTVLNFLMHLSGVATRASVFTRAMAGTGLRLLDTRKTTPGHRVLEKYAVAVGGGLNHRMNLAGGVLIKNNHIAVCGGVREAVRMAREGAPVTLRIEIEVRTLSEAVEAASAGADMLLLDHMTPDQVAEVRRAAGNRVMLEVSGNMTPEKAIAYADSGVDFVSAGSVVYGASWLDMSMYLDFRG